MKWVLKQKFLSFSTTAALVIVATFSSQGIEGLPIYKPIAMVLAIIFVTITFLYFVFIFLREHKYIVDMGYFIGLTTLAVSVLIGGA